MEQLQTRFLTQNTRYCYHAKIRLADHKKGSRREHVHTNFQEKVLPIATITFEG